MLALDPKSVPDPQPSYKRAPGWLWNGQVAPLVPYAIKGVIWYQGESNVARAAEYMRVFPNMIHDWRADFPFYFVQIAPWTGYGNGTAAAELREAQDWSMKSVRKTGMIVTTDITDDFGDIHPINKQDVGKRLARSTSKTSVSGLRSGHWPSTMASGSNTRDRSTPG